jgi:hypothetical protein
VPVLREGGRAVPYDGHDRSSELDDAEAFTIRPQALSLLVHMPGFVRYLCLCPGKSKLKYVGMFLFF